MGEKETEEMSIAELQKQIEETDKKIRDCREAQQKVEYVRGITQPKKTNWWFSYRALKNNEELRNVKREEVFEGEMADALKQKVEETGRRIEEGMDKTENLLSALKGQIENLKRKIQELEAQKSRLKQELAREIELERARAREAQESAGRRE